MKFTYQKWDGRNNRDNQTPFEQLLDLFQQLLVITSGDVSETLKWMSELDKQYNMTDQYDDYDLGDFIEDLKDRGYIQEDDDGKSIIITRKAEQSLRKKSLEDSVRNLEKGG